MSYSSAMKFDIEKFDGRINFGLWKVQVNDVLIQSGLHKALKGNTSKMKADKWEELDLRAASAIRLCLAKNVLTNVQNLSSAKELWERLEGLYQAKDISNRLLLKEQFHNLRMDEGTKISDHLSTLNNIVSELESIKVEIDDEDKALRLIWSLPPSYVHLKPVLMYGKEKLNFGEVATKIISEERRMKSDESTSSSSMLLTRSGTNEKKIHAKNLPCWKCGRSGHLKRNCLGGAVSEKDSETSASNVSLVLGDDGDLI
ncbi:Pol polyprotein/retrotransposon [Trifolium repens]|nr:Pol polyprotein/retrotransposon [Trifolium repens]